MKFSAVFLALVIITGSQAAAPSNEPSTILDSVNAMFQDTAKSFTNSLQNINARVVNGLKVYQQEVEKQFPVVQRLTEKFIADAQLLVQGAEEMMGKVKQRVKLQLVTSKEDLGSGIQWMQENMEPYTQEWCQNICPAPSP